MEKIIIILSLFLFSCTTSVPKNDDPKNTKNNFEGIQKVFEKITLPKL
jgi:PBP1b-binding outer membrane lipoprotein LpoB